MRLGEWLQAQQRITADQLHEALSLQASRPEQKLGDCLRTLGHVDERTILDALAAQYQCRVVDEVPGAWLDRSLVRELPVDFLRAGPMLPVRVQDRICILTTDPAIVVQHPELSLLLSEDLEPLLARDEMVRHSIDACFARSAPASPAPVDAGISAVAETRSGRHEDRQDLLRVSESAPVAARVSRLLLDALDQSASDIHLEPRAQRMEIRFRVDGRLYEQGFLAKDMEDAVVSRIKIMAHLDIAERRLPQDGNARVSVGSREVDVRVSSIPVADGERVVLRLLGRESTRLSLAGLGMNPELMESWRALVLQPFGVVWVTGPTGSGKTTTLYAALQEIDTRRKNILTIEDPVEYQLPSIGQMNVQPRIGLTFATGLRHILRQDPDVILVGETRDEETAEIVVRASMTGHLVLSTLHANDALSASVRLVDMGIAPYLVAEATRGALSQRLLRRICPHCGQQEIQDAEDWPAALQPLAGQPLSRAVGCDACREGYLGRVGVFELLTVDSAVREGIRAGLPLAELRTRATAGSFHTLWQDAVAKLRQGVTTPDEALTVLGVEG